MAQLETSRKGETISAFMQSNARGLAKLGAYMANDGALGNKRLLSEESVADMLSEPDMKPMMNMAGQTCFTKGGVALCESLEEGAEMHQSNLKYMGKKPDYKRYNDFVACRNGFYGWMGFGGSVFQWNPEQHISFAFVNTDVFMTDRYCRRGGMIQKCVLEIVKSQQ